jgi:hypothetical protein
MLYRALDLASKDVLGRRYPRDGLCVKAAIVPCDTTEECCEHGVQCVINDRAAFDANAAEAAQLFDAMSTAMQGCRTAFNTWHGHAAGCQEIGALTARDAQQADGVNKRLFSWSPAGSQQSLDFDKDLDVKLSAACQIAARLLTRIQDTRLHVSYFEFPVKISAAQINTSAEQTCDDAKVHATQVAATAQVPSPAPSATKSRAEK